MKPRARLRTDLIAYEISQTLKYFYKTFYFSLSLRVRLQRSEFSIYIYIYVDIFVVFLQRT